MGRKDPATCEMITKTYRSNRRSKYEDGDKQWHTCTLMSRAGKAPGKYSMAWNISRDGVVENIDFDRDVEEFRLIEAVARQDDHNMFEHLTKLIEAAELRELATSSDE